MITEACWPRAGGQRAGTSGTNTLSCFLSNFSPQTQRCLLVLTSPGTPLPPLCGLYSQRGLSPDYRQELRHWTQAAQNCMTCRIKKHKLSVCTGGVDPFSKVHSLLSGCGGRPVCRCEARDCCVQPSEASVGAGWGWGLSTAEGKPRVPEVWCHLQAKVGSRSPLPLPSSAGS